MSVKNLIILRVSRVIYFVIKLFGLGSGSTWPGHIALALNPNFIEETLLRSNLKTILVVGTNGKTTTAKLLRFILGKNSISSTVNEEGANLLNGITSTVIKDGINFQVLILEIDENTLPLILEKITPYAVIMLNLFRDQLDRYGEVNTIALKWQESLKKLVKDTFVFINADDPRLGFIGEDLKARVKFFALPANLMQKKEIPHDVDSVHCPSCGEVLSYSAMSYSHLGDYFCTNCPFRRPKITELKTENLKFPLVGIYNIYNALAVVCCTYFAFKIPVAKTLREFTFFKPAFGRQETVVYKDRKIFIILSKNPAGFNQSIEAVSGFRSERKNFLVVLNDRIPDGRDVSWIWDVEFEKLIPQARHIVVSGDRPYDMALRFKYGFENGSEFINLIKVEEKLDKALDLVVNKTKIGDSIYILATYSAMLETRQIIFGRKLL